MSPIIQHFRISDYPETLNRKPRTVHT